MADLENLLDNGPSVTDLTEVIAFQCEEIQRLENVLKHYDWIETATQPPTKADGRIIGRDLDDRWYSFDWTEIVSDPQFWPLWCRVRPINRRCPNEQR